MLIVTVGADGHEVVEELFKQGYKSGTNNQMEIQACIDALDLIRRGRTETDLSGFQKLLIWTDSMYVVDGFRSAQTSWPQHGWMTRDGTPVLNVSLWKGLLRAARSLPYRIEIRWIKGHSKNVHNRRADKLARLSADMATGAPLSVVGVRRRTTGVPMVRGCVPMLGQMLTIRIITCERLRVHRCWKYTYEVTSETSPYFPLSDLVFSEHMMSEGHTYVVRFNDETKNPRILKVFREVTG